MPKFSAHSAARLLCILVLVRTTASFLHTSILHTNSISQKIQSRNQAWFHSSKFARIVTTKNVDRSNSKPIVCAASVPNNLRSTDPSSAMLYNAYSEITKGQIQVHEVEQGIQLGFLFKGASLMLCSQRMEHLSAHYGSQVAPMSGSQP